MKIKDGKITFTKKEIKAGLKTLENAKALLKKGKRWIKGDYEMSNFDDNDNFVDRSFCMIGAINEADGPGEDIAKIALIASIGKITPPDANSWMSEEEQIAEDGENIVTKFNDKKTTKYKDVSMKMTKAAAILRKGSIPLKK